MGGLTHEEAQELLDWLEQQSVETQELTFDASKGFSIRWRVKQAGKDSTGLP